MHWNCDSHWSGALNDFDIGLLNDIDVEIDIDVINKYDAGTGVVRDIEKHFENEFDKLGILKKTLRRTLRTTWYTKRTITWSLTIEMTGIVRDIEKHFETEVDKLSILNLDKKHD